jgi:hypothetical protein
MSAKEKANEIFDKMYQNQETTAIGGNNSQYGNARRCSLLLVDEILKTDLRSSPYEKESQYDYWKAVRVELERL